MIKRKIEKILLIQSPRTIYKETENPRSAPPLGLAYLAAVLENHYDVKILDSVIEGFSKVKELDNGMIQYGLDFEDIDKRILEYKPDVIGISSIFSYQHPNVRKLASRIRDLSKDIIIVTGGDHPTALPKKVMEEDNVDYIILGEGEYSFRSLLKEIETGGDLNNVDGLAFKEGGEIKINPQTNLIQDLDTLPFPARHLLPMDIYSEINMSHCLPSIDEDRLPYTPILTSRGCPAACTYCSCPFMWGEKKFRVRSVENVLQEIELLVSQGYKSIYFDDDNFTFYKERAHKILDGILSRKWDITWSLPNGVALNKLDRQLLEKMKAAGCKSICLPIESGSQRVVSKVMQKPLNLKVVPGLVKDMKELDIFSVGFFLIGTPGEKKEEIQKTIDIAVDLKQSGLDYAEFFITIPLPGTKIYDESLEKGYIKNLDVSKMNIARGVVKTPDFDPEYLEKTRHRAWIECNFSYNTDFILYPDDLNNFESKIARLKVKENARILVGGRAPLLEKFLKNKEKNYDLMFFTKGNEILKEINSNAPDFLLLEKELPDMKGWNVLRMIRKDKSFDGFPVMLIVKEDIDLLKDKDITWLIQEVLDKKKAD